MNKFKVVITKESTQIKGTIIEALTGLLCYIDGLREMGVPNKLIKEILNEAIFNNTSKVETLVDNDKFKIKKIDLNDMTKEEAKKFLDNELFNKIFD